MCHFLEAVGRVIQADSGRGALEVLEEREPEPILLDLHMPDIDGFTF
jgi:CheY-like chemotaxis protein